MKIAAAFAIFAALTLVASQAAERSVAADELPPASSKIGPLKRDPVTGRIVPAEPRSSAPEATLTPRAPAAPKTVPRLAPPREVPPPRTAVSPRTQSSAPTTIHLCRDMAQASTCTTTSLQDALDRVPAGGSVVIHSGTYRQAGIVRKDGTHILALAGAALVGTAVAGKAALVVQADGVVIEGLACSGIAVPDRNGACVRHEGGRLTLRRVHFHDAEQGVLAGKGTGAVVIEASRFERLGLAGRAHGIYVSGDSLTVRGSLFLAARDEGHEIKSRATRTLIENSVVASLDSRDSYLIDVSNGGEAVIRGNVLQEGPNSSNATAIAYGLEGVEHANSSLQITGNLILMARRDARIVRSRGTTATFENNFIVGHPGRYTPGSVTAGCGDTGNVCAARFVDLLTDLPAFHVPGFGGVAARSGLLD